MKQLITQDKGATGSNSLKHLFADDAFCIRVAKHFYPQFYKEEGYIEVTWMGKILFQNPVEDRLMRNEQFGFQRFDASFLAWNCFANAYVLKEDNTIEREIKPDPMRKCCISGQFNIIARKKIATTLPLFIKALRHYRADTLIVEEIAIDDLSLDEIKKVAGEYKYRVALVGEIMG